MHGGNMEVGYELNDENQVICWYFDNLDDLEVEIITVNNRFREELGDKLYKLINNELIRDIEKEELMKNIQEIEKENENVTEEEYFEKLKKESI